MKILVTGSDGFIGSNLCVRLKERDGYQVIKINRSSSKVDLHNGLDECDFIYHLAGINRPQNPAAFQTGNSDFTQEIIDYLSSKNKKTPIVLSSSIQATQDNPYGKSKFLAEKSILHYHQQTDADYYIFRLPNVFGKWCQPNYNSFVATFCANLAEHKPITIHNANEQVNMVYIDDVCDCFINLLLQQHDIGYKEISPTYLTTVGDVAQLLTQFRDEPETLLVDKVATGFQRALYATWLSYLNPAQICYDLVDKQDSRGLFCELIKTNESGQFSFLTAHPGITRGGHYHHTKNEKFIVVHGEAKFRFKNIKTGEQIEKRVSSQHYEVVRTLPGWAHDITNIGESDLIIMLWANEIFDPNAPDTIPYLL